MSTDLAHIDFETRSELELPEVGAWTYAAHPSTTALCLAYQLPAQPCWLWFENADPEQHRPPIALVEHIQRGGLVGGFSTQFEEAIWVEICVKRWGWPVIPPSQWRCTMAKATAFALPDSLAKATAAMGCATKDEGGRALMLRLCKPAAPVKADANPWRLHTPENLDKLGAYCQQDVKAEAELDALLPDLSADELPVYLATAAINRRGQQTDRDGARACLRILDLAAQDWAARVNRATGGLLVWGDLDAHQAIKDYALARGVALASTDKNAVVEALARTDLPADVRVVLEARQVIGKKSTAKVQALLDRVSPDGRIRGGLVYHGATTGRWTEKGLQRQNLPKHQVDDVEACLQDAATMDLETFRMLWGDPYHAVSGCIRGLLTAAPGHTLIAADYAAIEARVVMWLAGDPGIAMFALGDPYKEMAGWIYGVPAATIKKPSKERDVGKAAFLGGGFGMGWARFQAQLMETARVEISDAVAQAGIKAYRERFPHVPKLWYGLEDAAVQAVRAPGTTTSYRTIRYKQVGQHLYCRLPSGRKLVYPFAGLMKTMTPWQQEKDAVTFMAVDTLTKQWSRQHTYGGSLAENVTQAAARDLTAQAILRCEARGLPVVSTAHDEVVSEIPETHPITCREYEALVCELPEWAAGLPVKAEAWREKRYHK